MDKGYNVEKTSSHGSDPKNVAYTLDQRRRAALAEVDNASFSYVSLFSLICLASHILQMVPCQGRLGRQCRFLH